MQLGENPQRQHAKPSDDGIDLETVRKSTSATAVEAGPITRSKTDSTENAHWLLEHLNMRYVG